MLCVFTSRKQGGVEVLAKVRKAVYSQWYSAFVQPDHLYVPLEVVNSWRRLLFICILHAWLQAGHPRMSCDAACELLGFFTRCFKLQAYRVGITSRWGLLGSILIGTYCEDARAPLAESAWTAKWCLGGENATWGHHHDCYWWIWSKYDLLCSQRYCGVDDLVCEWWITAPRDCRGTLSISTWPWVSCLPICYPVLLQKEGEGRPDLDTRQLHAKNLAAFEKLQA